MGVRRLFPLLLASFAMTASAAPGAPAPHEPSTTAMCAACAIGLLGGWAAGSHRWKSMNRRHLARYVQKKRHEPQPDAQTGTR